MAMDNGTEKQQEIVQPIVEPIVQPVIEPKQVIEEPKVTDKPKKNYEQEVKKLKTRALALSIILTAFLIVWIFWFVITQRQNG